MITHKNISLFFIFLLLLLFLLKISLAINELWFLIIALLWIGINAFGSSRISSNYHVKAFCSNPLETEKKIALTFDDGPSIYTLEVLELLKKYNAKATFFCIGKNIETHPEILQKVIDEGHLVGNHSYSHSKFFDFYNSDKIREELQKTDALLEKFTSKKINFFRPPYGVTTPSIRRALKVTGHKTIGWNIRSLDGGTTDVELILNRIKKRVSPGGIVLLHDTGEHSVLVLEQFLQFLQQNNYKVVSIEELLNLNAYEIGRG
ncbi:polysaccharide deacetylase family protein [Flavobacterium nitrogenifigens]|uniref:Peptidoglycan/xylan/chitin deacetylase, PgdA/CDA1 family n=1 Tax=Flavobacterium nitrogenifigens TaxID=1617283 RepID=A0A521CVD7_9FLAO|nr:polysaccharide deacetylase family protein [Flavobacterium nitrogenifigens]KAF2328349.1 polysaccharide deacetylase family protein [Flavobacterium nitrogenifigens]SMO62630.1 Peptidoglycan/xylan/chitin deacetylase, PgdA/CDA1 family [Flavobacterium nitrogenifigens]